jgi:hypothetical protein
MEMTSRDFNKDSTGSFSPYGLTGPRSTANGLMDFRPKAIFIEELGLLEDIDRTVYV